MKLVLPTILIATALVAGLFALMPVETATSVHTTIAANVTDQSRALYFQTDAGAAEIDDIIIPLAAGQAFQADVTLSSAGGVCLVEDTVGPTALVTGVNGDVIVATIGNANASTTNTAGFADDDDIRIDTAANTSCYLTFVITEFD